MHHETIIPIEDLRFAVIGLGRMGLRHVEAARRLGMNVCGAADISNDALEAAHLQIGIASFDCFTDAYEMLDKVQPDAVVIATTAPTHASFVLAAADRKVRYVLCEKPFACSLAESAEMIRACKRVGASLAVNHQMRFMAQYERVKKLIGSKELGPLVSILVAGSNFGLAMNASHYFEMFRYVSGENIRDVQAWFEDIKLTNPRGPKFEDRSGRLLARSTNFLTMFIDFSANAGWGLQVIYICRHGQIILDELNGDLRILARQSQYRDLPTSRYGMPVDIQNEKLEPTDTVVPTMRVWNALLSDNGYPTGEEGAHILACLVAAHSSHEASGRAVIVDNNTLDNERVFNWA